MALEKNPLTGSKEKLDLAQPEGLEALARQRGLEPPEENKIFSTLRKVGGVLNTGTAVVAGGVRGAIRKDQNVFEGMAEGFKNKETFGFSNILKEDLGIKPTTRGGKVALGVSSFIMDVAFDPITYLTFGTGAGLKVGGKTLTKQGTKLFQKASTEAFEKQTTVLRAAGESAPGDLKLNHVAQGRSTRTAQDLFKRATGQNLSEGPLTLQNAVKYMDKGIEEGTIHHIRQLGPSLIDKGGIKMFGKTMVSSERLAQTLPGKAARRLGETEVVKALSNSLGKMFVADFGKNKKLIQIIDKASRQQKQAMEAIVEQNKQLFTGLSDGQMRQFFDTVFTKKKEVSDAAKGLLEQGGKVSDEAITAARKTAKETLRKTKLTIDDFDGDKKLLDISNQLFEGVKKTNAKGEEIFQEAIVSKFAKLAGIPEDEMIKFYIPSKFEDYITMKEFATGNNLSGARLGFRKLFTGVEREDLIKNPFEAFSRGQVEIVTERIRDNSFRATLKSLGRQFDNEALARSEGYERITRKGFDGKQIEGYLPKEVVESLNTLQTKGFKPIDDLAKATGFDWATGLFKGYVTSLFPGFHTRNIISNQFLNMIKIGGDVTNPQLQKIALDVVRGRNLDRKIKMKTGGEVTIKELIEKIKKESDILDASGPFGKFEQFLDDVNKEFSRKGGLQKLNPLSRQNKALEVGRKFGSAAESQAKVVNILSNVIQGKSIREGIQSAEEALFNYGKLSDFERSVMRRIIPFYTFARKNAELQVKALARTPGLVAAQLKMFRGLSESMDGALTEEDMESLPYWVLESLGIKHGVDEHGRQLVYTGFGLPIEEFLGRFSGEKGIPWNIVENLMTQSNPLIKLPTERATGQDFFRGRPISELTNAGDLKVFLDLIPEPVAKELKEMIQWQEGEKKIYVQGKPVKTVPKYTANPFVLHFLRNLPTARIQGTAGFVSDEEETPLNKALRFFTGVKGWSIDKEEQEFFRNLDRSKELQAWLKRMGVLGELTIPFELKEKEDGVIKDDPLSN